MNAKIDNLLVFKDPPIKNSDRLGLRKNNKTKTNNNFQDNMKSFIKNEKDEYKLDKEMKNENKVDKKTHLQKTDVKEVKQNEDLDEKLEKEEISVENTEQQAYLVSLFKNHEQPHKITNVEELLEPKIALETDINLVNTSLSEDIENILLSDELSRLSSKLMDKSNQVKLTNDQELETSDLGRADKSQEIPFEETIVKIEEEGKNQVKALKINKSDDLEDLNKESEKSQGTKIEISELKQSQEVKHKANNNEKDLSLDKKDLIATETDTSKNDKAYALDDKLDLNTFKNVEIVQNKAEPIDMKKTIDQISEQMKFSINNNKNLIKINLKPATLGDLTMEIEVVENVLTAKIMVDNQKTKELLQNNLFQLKDELKDTGLEIKSFEVFVGSGNDFSKRGREQFNFNKFSKKNKENMRIRRVLKKNEDIEYLESSSRTNHLNENIEGSLNLLA